MDQLEATLAKIKETAARLNAAADSANAYIARIEKELDSVGVEVMLRPAFDREVREIYNDHTEQDETCTISGHLAYGRVDDAWGLCVIFFRTWAAEPHAEIEIEKRLLRNAARATRVAVVPLIPVLVDAIAADIEAAATAAEKTISTK